MTHRRRATSNAGSRTTDHRRRWTAALVGATALVAVSCGSDSDQSDDAVDTLPDADDLIEDADARGVSALELALAQSAEVDAYRVVNAAGQTMRIEPLGVNVATSPDLDRPTVIVEIDEDGDVMMTFDVSAAMGADSGLDVEFSLWQDDEQVLIDLTGYEVLADVNPALLNTPFRPGLARIDLARARELGGDDIVRLIAGQEPPDLAEVATALLALDGVSTATPSADGIYELDAEFGQVVEALGQDVADLATSAAAGVAPFIGVDPGELAAVYESVYRVAPTDLRIELDGDLLSKVEYEADMSGVWDELGPLLRDAGAPEAEIEALSDAVLIVESINRFEPDPDIAVDIPASEGFEDRTEEYVALFTS